MAKETTTRKLSDPIGTLISPFGNIMNAKVDGNTGALDRVGPITFTQKKRRAVYIPVPERIVIKETGRPGKDGVDGKDADVLFYEAWHKYLIERYGRDTTSDILDHLRNTLEDPDLPKKALSDPEFIKYALRDRGLSEDDIEEMGKIYESVYMEMLGDRAMFNERRSRGITDVQGTVKEENEFLDYVCKRDIGNWLQRPWSRRGKREYVSGMDNEKRVEYMMDFLTERGRSHLQN